MDTTSRNSSDACPLPSSPSVVPPADDPHLVVFRRGTRSTRNPYPIYNFLSYHRLSSTYCAFASTLSSVSLPKSLREALSHPGWCQAMVDEMTALHTNDT